MCRQYSNRQSLDNKLKPVIWFLLLWFIWFTYHRYNCAVFVHGCSARDQIFTLRQFSKNIGSLQKTSTHVLSTSSKQTTVSSWKALVSREDSVNGCLSPTIKLLSSRSNLCPCWFDLNNKQFTAGRAGLRGGGQRGQLPRALRSKGAPGDDIYLF